MCFATQETSAASETAEGPAQRWGGRGEATVEGAVRTRSHPKAKALGHTKSLLLSVPSERAAHRGGERRSPDTHEEEGLCTRGGSLHTHVGEHRNRADSCLQSSHLQIHPRDRVQVTCPGPPPPQTPEHGQAPGRGHFCHHRLPLPLGLTSAQDSRWLLSLAQTVPASEAPPPTLLPPCPLADVRMASLSEASSPLPSLPLPLQTLMFISCRSDVLLAFASQKT